MKNFVNFLKKNWIDALGIAMLPVAFVLYCMSDLLLVQHVTFWVTAVMCGITLLLTRPWVGGEWLTTGIYFLALSILWYLPIFPFWGLIPILIAGWIYCAFMELELGVLVSPFFPLIVAMALQINLTEVVKEEFSSSSTLETVVITYVDNTLKDDIRVFIEGKGIFSFDKNKETEDARKLSNGDTVQIVVYEHKISKLIY